MMALVVPKVEIITASSDPAAAAGKAFFGDIGGDEFGFGHDIDGEDVGVGEVHQDVNGGDDEHADDQAAGDVALGLFYFAGDIGEFVPAVIGPESALKGGGDANKEREALKMNR